jgi:hypothetical protein
MLGLRRAGNILYHTSGAPFLCSWVIGRVLSLLFADSAQFFLTERAIYMVIFNMLEGTRYSSTLLSGILLEKQKKKKKTTALHGVIVPLI